MCGRFTLTLPSAPELARLLGVEPSEAFSLLYRPRWNVAPTDAHWVVRLAPGSGEPEIAGASWGVAPPPAPHGKRRPPLINARSETVARMPGVRDAFRGAASDRGRCVVPVCGFYEWVGEPKAKRPIWFSAHRPAGAGAPGEGDDRGLLRFAGLWEPAPEGSDTSDPTRRLRFTILTTAANDVVAPVHDRMPVLLAPGDVDTWLRGDPEAAARLLRPAPAGVLTARAVVPRANSVKNDDPSCLDPWDPTLEIDLRPDASPVAERPGRPARTARRAAASKIATPSPFGSSPGPSAKPASNPASNPARNDDAPAARAPTSATRATPKSR